MSTHDPFDGVYDSVPAPRAESPKAEPSEAKAPEPEKTESAPVTRNRDKSVDTVYSTPFLRRQSKGDLQEIARDKGLDTSGGRDDLVDRIEADQRS